MLSLKRLAVTGGLSCGKSFVCRIFKELGAYTINADEIAHRLLSPDTIVGRQVIDLLGSDIVVDGRINRRTVAAKVFNNRKLLKSLEHITHPVIRDEIENNYFYAIERGYKTLFVAEIALLFESEFGEYDYSLAVVADREICLKRFMASTGYEEDEFNRRMSNQLDPKIKADRADFVLRNNGTTEELRLDAVALYNALIQNHKEGVVLE